MEGKADGKVERDWHNLDVMFRRIAGQDYKSIVVDAVCKYTGYVKYQRDYQAILENVLPNESALLYSVIADITQSLITTAVSQERGRILKEIDLQMTTENDDMDEWIRPQQVRDIISGGNK